MIKEERQEIERKFGRSLKNSEIGLILSSYDDIFSVFDPRPFSERSLSVDFLSEAERASKDKPLENLKLDLLVPKEQRDAKKESIIKRRLKEHFRKHFRNHRRERRKMIHQGAIFTIFGVIIMFLAVLVLHTYQETSVFRNFLVILFEPAGWFLFWEGLNLIIFEAKKVKPKIEFYKKMYECRINFFEY